MDTKELMTKIVQAEVVKALNSTESAIEILVQEALGKMVNARNGSERKEYGDTMVPFIDYAVGSNIRRATEDAVREVIQENHENIKNLVRSKLTDENVTDAFLKAITHTVTENRWMLKVVFASEKDSDR
jgi:phage baseplate assembly protein W